MRHIAKTTEPEALAAHKAAANEDWRPTYDNLDKAPVRDALTREQGFLCCYCGARVGVKKDDCHIEHLVPQSVDPARALDYRNILASCQGRDIKPPPHPKHCGHKRGTNLLEVTPLQTDCATYFVFSSSGELRESPEPGKSAPAQRTIQALGLGIEKLRAARAAAITEAIASLDVLPEETHQAYLQSFDVPDAKGHLAEFSFAIQAVLRAYLPAR